MTTEKQRARNARKRKKLRAHRAQANPNSPNAVEWPMVVPRKGYELYEFLVANTESPLPKNICYDVPEFEDTDGGISFFMHEYFRLPYIQAEKLGLYWFLYVRKDQHLSDDELKQLCRTEVANCLGRNADNFVVYIVSRP